MPRHFLAAWLITLAASFLVAAQAASELHQFSARAEHYRQLLQRNTDSGSDSNDSAKLTGALALYSLFGIFVFASVCTCVIGIIVTLQWPNPRACCYRTQHSDIPSSDSCGCCALHRLNIGFAVTWLALLVLLGLAFVMYLMAAAAVLAVAHAAIAYRLIRQLKASYAATAQLQLTAALEARTPPGLVTGVVAERPLPGVPIPGIPVIDIPMTVAVVEAQLQTHIKFGEQAAERRAQTSAATDGAGSGSSPVRAGPSISLDVRRAASGLGASTSASPRAAPSSAPSPGGVGGGRSGSGLGGKGASSGTIANSSSVAVPVAAVVDERLLQQREQQLQPRGVFAWGSPGQSTAAAAAGDTDPGPSGSQWSGAAAAAAAATAAGTSTVPAPAAVRETSPRGTPLGPGCSTRPERESNLPGSPGHGWR